MTIEKPHRKCAASAVELTPELYHTWGKALGRRLEPRAKFVVGGDSHRATPTLLAALVEGLCSAGINVVDLGNVPTPMVSYAKRRLRAEGCAVVCAARDASNMDGLRWIIGDRPPTPDETETLHHEALSGAARRCRRQPGARRELDISYDYVAWLQETWVDAMDVERRIVLDPSCGSLARRARRYLQAIFPRSLFSAIHDDCDGECGDRWPDHSHPEMQYELSAAVEHAKADLGIAFDGDGDRVVFVDNAGTVLSPEEATFALLGSFDGEAAGQPFVYQQNFSRRLAETARDLGVVPLAENGGHAAILARMLDSGAFFGAETSGHYFFRALEGGDDGLFTACWLIAWLAHRGVTLAELRAGCPTMFITPDFRVPVDPQHQSMLLHQIQATWAQYPQTVDNGVHVEFPDGWALVQSSVTSPALTFRFESSDWPQLRDLVWSFCDSLSDWGDELWMQFTASLGHSDGATCRR